jgi:hypothetical protein
MDSASDRRMFASGPFASRTAHFCFGENSLVNAIRCQGVKTAGHVANSQLSTDTFLFADDSYWRKTERSRTQLHSGFAFGSLHQMSSCVGIGFPC